jgi:RNA polymerase sigma-70 factor (ECF subfamily)
MPTNSVEQCALLDRQRETEERLGREAPGSEWQESAEAQRSDLHDVRRCLSGEGEAYRRLVDRHQQRVSAIMWRFSRDPDTHEDLVQDAFVEAYQSLATYRAEAPFGHWLARIATRVGYRHWKRERQEGTIKTVPLAEWDAALEHPADDVEPAVAAELLHGLLAQLPRRDRLVLTLRYVEEHSVERTAELTGWSKTMVKVQAWRARSKLKKLLEQATQGADR